MDSLTIKTCAHFAALIFGSIVCYLASIGIGQQPFNGADAAFVLLAITSVFMLTRIRKYAHKGLEAYNMMRMMEKGAAATISSLMKEFPEEEHSAVLERVQQRAIQGAIDDLQKAINASAEEKTQE